MTPKQEQFVREYLIDLNAAQAAIRAGYSPDTAKEQASRLLTNVNVGAAIVAAKAERSERTRVTADRVLAELARIGFGDVRRMFNDDGRLKHVTMLDDDAAACVSSIEVEAQRKRRGQPDGEDRIEYDAEATIKIKLWDKRAALVDIGKHLGMFSDKLEHTGALTINVNKP